MRRAFFFLLLCTSLASNAQFAGGDGTKDSPFLIETAEQLDYVRTHIPTLSADCYYRICKDIDLGAWIKSHPQAEIREKGWQPVSWAVGQVSTGIVQFFSGGGHTIRGLFIDRPAESQIGLFGRALNICIDSLHLDDCMITGNESVGGIVGTLESVPATGSSTKDRYLSHCSVSGKITGHYGVGGLAGTISISNTNGKIRIHSCRTSIQVFGGKGGAGGLIGSITGKEVTSMTDCYTHATVFSSTGSEVGGLAGYCNAVNIEQCYASGSVSGAQNVGGIIGSGYNISLSGCVAANQSVCGVTEAGRIIGMQSGNTTLFDNIAQKDMLLNGITVSGSSSGIQGKNISMSDLKLKSTYEDLNWDFSTVWQISSSKSFPYFRGQCFDPVLQTLPVSGTQVLNGVYDTQRASVVRARINKGEWQQAVSTGGNFSIQLNVPLSGNDIIDICAIPSATEIPSSSIYRVEYVGDGSEASPILVGSPGELDGIRYLHGNNYYRLTNDIDLSSWIQQHPDRNIREKGWCPLGIGTGLIQVIFNGHIEGRGFSIKGLHVNNPEIKAALIGNAGECTIENLTITDCQITGYFSGGLIASSEGMATLKNCQVSGYIGGSHYSGGLIAYARREANIDGCCVTGSIVSPGSAAGLIAEGSSNDFITNSHFRGKIKGRWAAGIAMDIKQIANSSVSAVIEGKDVSGIVRGGGIVENSYSSAIMNGDLVNGISSGAVNKCYAFGKLSGQQSNGLNTGSYTQATYSLAAHHSIIGAKSAFRISSSAYSWPDNLNNYALQDMLVNGKTVSTEEPKKQGGNASPAQIRTTAFYREKLDWDFDEVWSIREGISFPFFKTQSAPPELSSTITRGITSLQGKKSSESQQVWVVVNDNQPRLATLSQNNWTFQPDHPLAIGDIVFIYTSTEGKFDSHALIEQVSYEEGLGLKNDPFVIKDAEDLNAIRNNLHLHYRLNNDIDLTDWIENHADNDIRERGWLPIGYLSNTLYTPFSGGLYGNGFHIRGLRIDRPQADNVGLFSAISYGEMYPSNNDESFRVDSLFVDHADITGRNQTGCLAGELDYPVNACHASGSVNGENNLGGLFGATRTNYGKTDISNSSFAGSISGNNCIGGIIGLVNKPASGICDASIAKISKCHASAYISGNDYLGGMVGNGVNGLQHACTESGIFIELSDCYAAGVIKGQKYLGGIGGSCKGDAATITRNYATNHIVGTDYIGGLLGVGDASLSVALNPVLVSTGMNIGRISSSGSYTKNYALQSMTVNRETVSGQANDNNGQGMTTDQLLKKATYTELGWNMNGEWTINEPSATTPYFSGQVQAPVLLTTVSAGTSSLSGTFDSGQSSGVSVKVNHEKEVILNESSWQHTLDRQLIVGDVIQVRAIGKNKRQDSYSLFVLVHLSEGKGTEETPYLIHNADELNQMRCDKDACYRLANDIDLSDWLSNHPEEDIRTNGWMPVGSEEDRFRGALSGGGYRITGLRINRPDMDYVGLFGYSQAEKIDSLQIVSADITGGNAVGIVAGAMLKNISNSRLSGKVTGLNCVGGLAGLVDSGDDSSVTIKGNGFSGTVSGFDFTGGLIGAIDQKHSSSRQEGPYKVLVRSNYTEGEVMGNDHVGGLIGYIENRIYESGHSKSYTKDICQNYVSAIVKGRERIGGIVGYAQYDFWTKAKASYSIRDCYATGVVEGIKSIGGIIGYCDGYDDHSLGEIKNCYASNYIKGEDWLGGIAGLEKASVTGCYAMTPSFVVMESDTHPLVGYISATSYGSTNTSYHSRQTIIYYSDGREKTVTDFTSTKTREEFLSKETYESNGWDFESVWNIWEGYSYPYFFAEVLPGEDPVQKQIAPPSLDTEEVEGAMVLSGHYGSPNLRNGLNSISVWVKINGGEPILADAANGVWTCSLESPLKPGDLIRIWASADELQDSYSTFNIVGNNKYSTIDNHPALAKNSCSFYPNPVKDELIIRNIPTDETVAVLLYDLQGNLLYRAETVSDALRIPVHHLSTGTYLIKLIAGKEVITSKIIKN